MKKQFIASIILFGVISSVIAQDDTKSLVLGVLPVTSSSQSGSSYIDNVREKITNAFASKSRFTVVDRSRLDAIYQERNLQKREDFMDGDIVAQGKSIGAQFLVSTNISELTYANVIVQKDKWGIDKAGKVITWKENVPCIDVSMVVNIQLMDVSTGVIKANKNISQTPRYENQTEAHSCILTTLNNIYGYTVVWINEVFPVEMKIIRIETTDKKVYLRLCLLKAERI